jgi:hypothetical protein
MGIRLRESVVGDVVVNACIHQSDRVLFVAGIFPLFA